MARSLTIKHEEHAATSPLLTGFLLIAVGWLLAAMMFNASADAAPAAPSAPTLEVSGR